MAIKKKSTRSSTKKPRKVTVKRKSSRRAKNWMGLTSAYIKGIFGVLALVIAFTFLLHRAGTNSQNSVEIVHESETIHEANNNPFEAAEGLVAGDRAAYWSQHLAKLASQNVRLSVNAKAPAIQDNAPLLVSNYDCTTFVETVGAMTRSQRDKDFYRNMLSIRYKDSEGTYWTRNHFPEADWIPNNSTAGNLTDVTAEIAQKAGVEIAYQTKAIDKTRWFAKQLGKPVTDRKIASTDVKLAYIPKESMQKALQHVSNGLVVNLVRASNPKYDVLISHQGILLKKGDRVMFQHASTDGTIRTQPLDQYLSSQKFKGWPVVGINFNQWSEGWN